MLKTVISEDKALHIDDIQFDVLLNSDLKTIISAIESYGFQIRIVGGAVRDLLLGLSPRDIDLATNAKPDQIIFILTDTGIEVDAKGIAHGTIKAVIDSIKYEITSLDYTVTKVDNKIKIDSHNSWRKDALRRDFTINAMSLKLNGTIYDYTTGVDDLENEIVRPLPNFEAKVKNDPILILRFFKLLAKFHHPKFSKNTLAICIKYLDKLKNIKAERLEQEIDNIRSSAYAKPVLDLMRKLKIID